ncbi:MAG: Sir2 silent information regulator family NAD-dependent deacetylase, partial [Lachnospiraceae bacterium]|nr:Sir2 silent information regulator family NAD-dependent deacetylase [Lachnospiraceae bacterium]
MKESTSSYWDKLTAIKDILNKADAVIIGAGAGLSTSAGFTYSGERFEQYFSDFGNTYGFSDMYSGGFYPYETLEEHWGYWSRYIYVNRYMDAPKKTYQKIYELVKGKDYFVLTTNVDHCFQKAGFDKAHLFYTQGDYGLFQCSSPCHKETYDNEEIITNMVLSQGFLIEKMELKRNDKIQLKQRIPSYLIPYCP